MASMGGGSYLPWDQVSKTLKTSGMVNKVLQQICHAEGLKQNGVKADLQARITAQLKQYAERGSTSQFERLKKMIENPSSMNFGHHYSGMGQSSSPAATPPSTPHSGVSANGYNMPSMLGFRAHGHQSLEFKPSPFFSIQQQLGETKDCMAMSAHRHTVSIPLRVSDHPILSRVAKEPLLRVMAFCASEGQGRQDISFPHQSELKVNGGEIKANLRGLKNKPGSTRPVDLTKDLRLNIAAYSNNVELTYALTTKKFYFLIFVVKVVPVADLVARLDMGKRITKETIITDMVNKSRDADIIATASVLSLKCPLSTLRIDLPVRSMTCRHNQCFDATSYLQLQEQGPTWLCPICNNSAPFDSLAVDEYVKDILKTTSKSVDQVTIQPNGVWELHTKPETASNTNGFASDDDDDLVEITKSGDSLRMGTPRAYGTPSLGGQPASSREQSSSSVAPRSVGSVSSKRPAAVIDLTSSGDEDDEPLAKPAAKRQFVGYPQTSLPSLSSLPPPPTFRPYPSPSPASAPGFPRSN